MDKGPRADGAFLRACCKSLSRYGVCNERVWPYDPRLVAAQPSPEAQANARKYRRSIKYFKVQQTEYDICSVLSQGYPIMCGLRGPNKNLKAIGNPERPFLYPPTRQQWAERRSTGSWGGHAVLMVGYDRTRRLFKFQNSWGGQLSKPRTDRADFFYAPFNLVLFRQPHDVNDQPARDFWTIKVT